MKRSFIITLALIAAIAVPLCASSGWARGLGVLGLGGGAAASGLVYTDCSNIGTAALYWTGEHSSGTNYACITNSTTINAASLSGSIVSSGTDPGAVSPASGGNVIKILGTQNIQYTITGTDIFDPADGLISIDVYLSASTGSNRIFYARGTNSIDSYEIYIDSGNAVVVKHIGNSVQVQVNSNDTVPDGMWTNVQARWSVALNRLSVKVGGGAWQEDVDPDTLTTWATSGLYMRFPGNLSSDTTYTDNTTVYKDSGL